MDAGEVSVPILDTLVRAPIVATETSRCTRAGILSPRNSLSTVQISMETLWYESMGSRIRLICISDPWIGRKAYCKITIDLPSSSCIL